MTKRSACFARIFPVFSVPSPMLRECYAGSYFSPRRNCEAALSDEFQSNTPAIYAECSLLHKPSYLYICSRLYSRNRIPTSTLIPRNRVIKFSHSFSFSRTTKDTHTSYLRNNVSLMKKSSVRYNCLFIWNNRGRM